MVSPSWIRTFVPIFHHERFRPDFVIRLVRPGGAVVHFLKMTAIPAGDRSARRAILWGWLSCGVLDITSAIIISITSGSTPIRMLQGVAGAVLGPQTYDLGLATAALGLVMHFCVALTATVIFYLWSRRIPAMVDHAVVSGILFGVFWLLVMYRGVIPLLAALRPLYLGSLPKRPLPALWPLPILVHMTCVGLPIALSVSRFGPRPRASAAQSPS